MTEAIGKQRAWGPVGTWTSMVFALLAALALVDWTNSGEAKPLWMFLLPLVFGLIGGGIAMAKRAYLLAMISSAIGVFALPIMNVIITLVQGP